LSCAAPRPTTASPSSGTTWTTTQPPAGAAGAAGQPLLQPERRAGLRGRDRHPDGDGGPQGAPTGRDPAADGGRGPDGGLPPRRDGTRWTASAELPLQESYTPVVSFLSDSGRRIQTLDPLSTDELLSVRPPPAGAGTSTTCPTLPILSGAGSGPETGGVPGGGPPGERQQRGAGRFPIRCGRFSPPSTLGKAIPSTPPTWRLADREGHYEVWPSSPPPADCCSPGPTAWRLFPIRKHRRHQQRHGDPAPRLGLMGDFLPK
jgi:hypothetical protein